MHSLKVPFPALNTSAIKKSKFAPWEDHSVDLFQEEQADAGDQNIPEPVPVEREPKPPSFSVILEGDVPVLRFNE